MISKFTRVVALATVTSLSGSAVFAAASDYAFEPINAEMKKGDDVTVAVRLTNRATGKPVPDAVIILSLIHI